MLLVKDVMGFQENFGGKTKRKRCYWIEMGLQGEVKF